MGEILVRLAGGHHPSAVAGLLSEDTAEKMTEVINERSANDAEVAELFRSDDEVIRRS